MTERKKEYKHIERNGKKIKLERYEGTDTWQVSKEQDDES